MSEIDYEYVRADLDTEGGMVMRYKLRGSAIEGSESWDEDVSGWTDSEIQQCVADAIDCDPSEVEIVWL